MIGKESPDTSITAGGRLQFGAGLRSLDNIRFDFDDALLEVSGPASMSMLFSGFAEAKLDGDKPHIKMTVGSPQLEVIEAEDGHSTKTESQDAAELLFDTSPLDYSGLNLLDLDADIRVASASVLGNQLSELQIAASLHGGHLKVSLFEFAIDDGGFSGTLDLVPAEGQHKLQLAPCSDSGVPSV